MIGHLYCWYCRQWVKRSHFEAHATEHPRYVVGNRSLMEFEVKK
jgi:hypothetical protein